MARLRGRLRRLEQRAQGDGIVLRLQDGTVRAFPTMEVQAELFLSKIDLIKGIAHESEVLESVRNATPESRAEFEERFGPITFSESIVSGGYEGGWVKVRTLTEDGRVEEVFHDGASPEAGRILAEARKGGPAF